MSFLLSCPLCGPRDVYEFRFGGEVQSRPAPGSDQHTWGEYLYMRTNVSGVERAWWFHRAGCRRWFQAERDTRTNTVSRSGWAPLGGPSASGSSRSAPSGSSGSAPSGSDTSGGEATTGA
jgi:heterotetrameric sarcosine oxidase delta subunit